MKTIKEMLFKKDKPKVWYIEVLDKEQSNTIRIQVYKNGCPYGHFRATFTDECKDMAAEKIRFTNMVRQLFHE